MKKEFSVTPWEVKGKIDYNRLIKEFGLEEMPSLPEEFKKNVLFRRGIVFAHRDLGRILDAIKNNKKFVMMTGLMPTGKFHLGHMLLAQQFLFYQKLGAKIYIAVADIEAYHARGQSLEESRKIAFEEYIKNYFALGLKPKNVEIYFQSDRAPKNGIKAGAYYKLQNLLARHVTFNEFKAVYGEITPGKMLSSLLQAADMLHPQLKEFEGEGTPVIVPVGADQDPHLRLARDISQRIKSYKFVQLSSTCHKMISGLKENKMSSSDPTSYIGINDSAKEVEKKIKKYAFSGGRDTLEEHREKGGNPDVDVSFQYLQAFFEPSDKELATIEKDYRSGKMTTGELKEVTIKRINEFLKKVQENRNKVEIEKFV